MGVRTRSKSSSERQKWDRIFNAIVEMVRTGQDQLETLVEERKILEDRIQMQHERWVSDVRHYEDCISQLKTELEIKEKACSLEAAKADMFIGLKRREASICKLKLEEVEGELSDFRCIFDILTACNNTSPKGASEVSKDISSSKRSNLDSSSSKTLKSVIRRLKLQSEAIAFEKNSQVAAMSSENEFIRYQFNLLERDLMDKLKGKDAELREAHKNIEALIANTEKLNSSAFEKDKTIERLKDELSRKEADIKRFDEELLKTSKELDLLRKTRNSSVTPVIRHCPSKEKNSILALKNGGSNGSNVVVETSKGSSRSKRKEENSIPISEIPKLFSSSFKVPKLKTR